MRLSRRNGSLEPTFLPLPELDMLYPSIVNYARGYPIDKASY
jgi:hypothetical protein